MVAQRRLAGQYGLRGAPDEEDRRRHEDNIEQQHRLESHPSGDDDEYDIHAQVQHVGQTFVDQLLDELDI